MTEITTKICKFYMRGTCRYGENCAFRHLETSAAQEEAVTTHTTGAKKLQKLSFSMEVNFIDGDDNLVCTNSSSHQPPPLDTDQLRKKKCRNRSSATKKRRASSTSSETQSNKRLSIHSPDDISYLNYVKFISLELRASVLLRLYQTKQKSLQLCEAYFDNKIVFDVNDYERADLDGYSEAEMHAAPFFHKYIRPLNDNEQMDWGLMFNEDVHLRFKFTTALYRQSSNCCQHLGVRDSVMIPFSVYKSLHLQNSNVFLPNADNNNANSDEDDPVSSEEVYDYCGFSKWDGQDSDEDEPFSEGDFDDEEEFDYDEDFVDY